MLSASMPSAARASGLSGIALSVRGNTPPPLRDQRLVIIVPARSRQLEQPLALGPALCRIGIGIDEDVAVVEGGDQLDRLATAACRCRTRRPTCRRSRRPAPARVCTSTPISRKWRCTESHAPSRGDAHRLVVVALRTAAGEGVVEPEVALGGDGVGGVGEGRGALVGGDHEIGIVAVADHASRRDARPCRATILSVSDSSVRMKIW